MRIFSVFFFGFAFFHFFLLNKLRIFLQFVCNVKKFALAQPIFFGRGRSQYIHVPWTPTVGVYYTLHKHIIFSGGDSLTTSQFFWTVQCRSLKACLSTTLVFTYASKSHSFGEADSGAFF